MIKIFCSNCKKEVLLEGKNKLSFREACPFCDFDLHICINCSHFDENKPNSCLIWDVQPVRDKEKNNYCEHFSPSKIKKEKDVIKEKEDIEKKLFKTSDNFDDDKKDDFDFLFKD